MGPCLPLLAALVLGAAPETAGPSAAATEGAATWSVVPSPNGGPMAQGNVLLAAAALSPTDAWAVGAQPNPSQFLTAALAMHWDGTQWTIVDTEDPETEWPTAQLNSIAAIDAANVWAAGYTEDPSCICGRTLVQHWDGTAWRRVRSPNPGIGNYLAGIAAASVDDVWAVGYEWLSQAQWVPLVMHYDGASWATFDQSALPFGRLSAVFARASDDAWAVGWVGTVPAIEGLALHWDGNSWTRVLFPTEPGGWILLRGVSGTAPDDVWAVGVYQYVNGNGQTESLARSYHWDGASWTAVFPGVAGRDSRMYAVAARASDDVWAVGGGQIGIDPTFRYVTLHWDGSDWSSIDNPNQGVLYGISASSSADAWAVGFGFVTPGTHTLHYAVP